ncbi:WD40-repeat-containing domain protein [Globomyces pollinis-pini]|nr:WD40-repeat-containing domain protein [Globomyces pollinis-pini]
MISKALKAKPVKQSKDNDDENEQSDEGDLDDMDLTNKDNDAMEEDEDEAETPAQKRLRLAKSYLAKVQEDVDDDIMEGEIDAQQLDRDLIAERLEKDVEDAAGRTFQRVADSFSILDVSNNIRVFKNGKKSHQLSLTCCAISSLPITKNERPSIFIYTASKDAVIVKWDFWTGERIHVFPGGLKPTKRLLKTIGAKNLENHIGHNDNILCMDSSSDGKYLVTGGVDKKIYIWSVENNSMLGKFTQHRDAISGLKFRRGHNQLYSASFDRTVKVWQVDEMSYVETLFGHQDKITSIDALSRERCVTAGSRDKTCRLWKIPEESQLVFRSGGGKIAGDDLVVMEDILKHEKITTKGKGDFGGSTDILAMIDDEHFVTGSDSGAISLWSTQKKKPLYTNLRAHGPGTNAKVDGKHYVTKSTEESCCWITSLAAIPYTDLFASGSGDGYIKFWKLNESKRSFTLLNSIPMKGFVNSMSFFEAPSLDFQPPQMQKVEGSEIAVKIKTNAEIQRLIKSAPKQWYLVCVTGQEHRLGRWWKLKSSKNQVAVVSLPRLK